MVQLTPHRAGIQAEDNAEFGGVVTHDLHRCSPTTFSLGLNVSEMDTISSELVRREVGGPDHGGVNIKSYEAVHSVHFVWAVAMEACRAAGRLVVMLGSQDDLVVQGLDGDLAITVSEPSLVP